MRASRTVHASSIATWTILTLLLSGCAMEFTPTREAMFYPKKLPAADRAVEAARSSGKAAQCPDAFAEAES